MSTTEASGTVFYQHDARGSIVFLPHLYNDGATPDPTPKSPAHHAVDPYGWYSSYHPTRAPRARHQRERAVDAPPPGLPSARRPRTPPVGPPPTRMEHDEPLGRSRAVVVAVAFDGLLHRMPSVQVAVPEYPVKAGQGSNFVAQVKTCWSRSAPLSEIGMRYSCPPTFCAITVTGALARVASCSAVTE